MNSIRLPCLPGELEDLKRRTSLLWRLFCLGQSIRPNMTGLTEKESKQRKKIDLLASASGRTGAAHVAMSSGNSEVA